ncbi:MAG TPA: SIMPL domain-containing protein [Anaerovoracaceae bacterium]|nr:SIMPL domain-containing protein [Anaerovoracaceae bacterium]
MFESFMNGQLLFRSMTLSGQGQVTLIPDIAVIRLGVQLTGTDLASIQSQNAQLSQAVLDALRRMGITDIKTFQYTIDKYNEYVNGTPVDRGYTVRNILEIRTGDAELIGAVIDTMEKAKSISMNLGIQIDSIPINITENSSMPRPSQAFQRELAATPIVPGNVTIEANITAEFVY